MTRTVFDSEHLSFSQTKTASVHVPCMTTILVLIFCTFYALFLSLGLSGVFKVATRFLSVSVTAVPAIVATLPKSQSLSFKSSSFTSSFTHLSVSQSVIRLPNRLANRQVGKSVSLPFIINLIYPLTSRAAGAP